MGDNTALKVFDKLNVQVEIKKILKDSKFEKDELTGFFYIKNRVDGQNIFEYKPDMLILYFSKHISNYLLYLGFDKKDLDVYIKEAMKLIFDINFVDFYEYEISMIENIKKSKLKRILTNKIYDGVLCIPSEYINIDKLYLELISSENDYSKEGFTRKFALSSFDKMDISGMCNGTYGLYVYEKGDFKNPLNFRIKIINTIDNIKNNYDN